MSEYEYTPLRLKTNDPKILRARAKADAHRDSLKTGDTVSIRGLRPSKPYYLIEPYNNGFCYHVSRHRDGRDSFGINIKDMKKTE